MSEALATLLQELRHAVRAIVSRPALSALIVGVLATGLACVFFMLVIIKGWILRPLPFADPDQLLYAGVRDIGNTEQIATDDLGELNGNDVVQLRRQLAGLGEVASYSTGASINFSDGDHPERYSGGIVSSNLFHLIGVAPILGRDFVADDGRAGASAVVMLSYRLWRNRYALDPGIVGRQVRVNAGPATVIGVMPEDYGFPGNEAAWIPDKPVEGSQFRSDNWGICVVVRRLPTVSVAAVRAAADVWLAEAARASPQRFHGKYALIEALTYYTPRLRLLFNLMLAATGLVLLVACANAANLMVTRALSRQQEFAVRVALGSSRARLALHFFLYGALLSLAAAATALPLVAHVASLQESVLGSPPWQHFRVDGSIMAFAFATALMAGLAVAAVPARWAGKRAAAGPTNDDNRAATGNSFIRVSHILTIGEIALSCALLICLGTLVRAVATIEHVHLGIQKSHLLTARLDLPIEKYPTSADQLRLYETLAQRLRAEGDVVDATVGSVTPGAGSETRDVLPDGAAVGDSALPYMKYAVVDDHFLSAYGIKLLAGRFFDSRDSADSERVAVVDRRFAEKFGEGASVPGMRFRVDPRDRAGPTVTVIGVIETLTLTVPQNPDRHPAMLVPLSQGKSPSGVVAIRMRDEPKAFAPRLNAIMRAIDADIPLYSVADYAGVMRSVAYDERQNARWFGVFGIVALAIAASGLFGVTAFTVSRRTREIGVRRALGSSNTRVLRALLARVAWQIGVGLLLGVALGVPFARLLARYSGTVEVHDPHIVLAVVLTIAAAALLATIGPARRALRVDPITALRHE